MSAGGGWKGQIGQRLSASVWRKQKTTVLLENSASPESSCCWGWIKRECLRWEEDKRNPLHLTKLRDLLLALMPPAKMWRIKPVHRTVTCICVTGDFSETYSRACPSWTFACLLRTNPYMNVVLHSPTHDSLHFHLFYQYLTSLMSDKCSELKLQCSLFSPQLPSSRFRFVSWQHLNHCDVTGDQLTCPRVREGDLLWYSDINSAAGCA